LSAIALSIEVPFIFDRLDSRALCVHETFFGAQSKGQAQSQLG
jgi:hypothetical protein